MKMMFKIAKTELQSLFYSPIAWLLLVVFAYQVGMIMSGMLEDIVVEIFSRMYKEPCIFIFLCSQ